MAVALALVTIAVGLAYSLLGVLSVGEVLALRKSRGVSWFGIGFALMVVSCGPHHIIHGYHVLQGHDAGGALIVTTAIGLPAGVTFVWLRIEAITGRQGDRFISGTPRWLAIGPAVYFITVGALVGWSLNGGAGRADSPTTTGHLHGVEAQQVLGGASFEPLSLTFLTNAFVTVTYTLVGWYVARTQLRRRAIAGGWSLSGVSLAAIFPTCALMHLAYALTAGAHSSTAVFDVLGVPASVFFLVVVYELYRNALADWNRRPLVGTGTAPQRPSPWALDAR